MRIPKFSLISSGSDLLYISNIIAYLPIYGLKNVLITDPSTAKLFLMQNKEFIFSNPISILISKRLSWGSDMPLGSEELQLLKYFELQNIFASLSDSLKLCPSGQPINEIFVVGDKQLYNTAIEHPLLDKIYSPECIKNSYSGELQYLETMNNILNNGEWKKTRNGDTLSLFGISLSFNLANKILPIITTKRIPIRAIFEELMFFIRGQTDTKILEHKGINIWSKNTDRLFLDSLGFSNYNEGDIGPMYGYQWRFFGKSKHSSHYVDQLKYIINELTNNQNSRRIIMTTFNPYDVDKGVLYPCHGIVTQYYIKDKTHLCCNMYQRSADYFLGLPFNITSYSLLMYIICEMIKLNNNIEYKPHTLNIYIGDCHIYKEHIGPVKEQLKNIPYKFPTIELINTGNIKDINEFEYHHLQINNYKSHKKIRADMAP